MGYGSRPTFLLPGVCDRLSLSEALVSGSSEVTGGGGLINVTNKGEIVATRARMATLIFVGIIVAAIFSIGFVTGAVWANVVNMEDDNDK